MPSSTILAQAEDRFYRLAPAIVSVDRRGRDVPPSFVPNADESAMLNDFNALVAERVGVKIEDLPVMPIQAVFQGPFYFRCSLAPPYHAFTLGCADLWGVLAYAGEKMGISRNDLPYRKVKNMPVVPCLN